MAKKEGSTADHEFTKVTIARSKVDQLRAESEQCIGQLAFRADENLAIEVDVPDFLVKGDPTQTTTANADRQPSSAGEPDPLNDRGPHHSLC